MTKRLKIIIIFLMALNIFGHANSNENFFEKGLELYNNKKFDDAKFMFERSIVFNPKDSNSYLYLAKIYNQKEDQKKEEKNLDATLLIDPNNEEAILMLMKIGLEKSNFSKFSTLIFLSPKLSVVPALLDDATKYRLSIEIFLLCKTSIIFLPTFPVAPTIAIFMMFYLY